MTKTREHLELSATCALNSSEASLSSRKLIAGGIIRGCECGCGLYPGLYTRDHLLRGDVRGTPKRYLHGHSGKKTRFEPRGGPDYIEKNCGYGTPCWVWQRGASDNGYGVAYRSGRAIGAHRLYYMRHKGEIPKALCIDHLCRNRLCVNPAHLEAVTPAENVRRGVGMKLNAEQVEEIRKLCESGALSKKKIGELYGISGSYVSQIHNRRWWR